MTIEKGRDWGRHAPLPASGIVVRSDAEARAIVEEARRANEAIPTLGLLGGDLCRTLGGPGSEDRLRSDEAVTLACDLGWALVDGRIHWFVAHAILRRSWWHGRVIAAMNAQYRGDWDLGPRAHPGDGLLDISDGDLRLGDRWKARSRLVTGTHLPHPGIRVTRTRSLQYALDPTLDVWLDGQKVGRADKVSVRVEPEALTVVI